MSSPGSLVIPTRVVKPSTAADGRDHLQPLLDHGGPGRRLGFARYRATVTLDREWTGGYGAYLPLGKTMDTVRVRINGRIGRRRESARPVIDAGPFLKSGVNEIEFEVATSLRNRLLATRGAAAFRVMPGGPPERRGYGLLGPVVLRPYGQVRSLNDEHTDSQSTDVLGFEPPVRVVAQIRNRRRQTSPWPSRRP